MHGAAAAAEGRCQRALQRRTHTILGSRRGAVAVCLAAFLAADSLIGRARQLFGLQNGALAPTFTADNIAGRDFSERLCSEPFDLVYTWVNGSDPWLQSNIAFYRLLAEGGSVAEAAAAAAGTAAEMASAADLESAAAASRFEDNDELRYSLRSVERYAPWVRNIYIVTNGQVPHWLDVRHPRLVIVAHHDLFPNPSELPTFSSPAIECHLHRIPGLSRRFLYLNDDTLFGNEVWPDDFWTHAEGHRIWLSWPVPDCAESCTASWLGDGFCDKHCNTTDCQWDGGDCIGPNVKFGYSSGGADSLYQLGAPVDKVWYGGAAVVPGEAQEGDDQCSEGCPDSSIGDNTCDAGCNVAECGYDVTDCGVSGAESLWSVPVTDALQRVPGEIGAFAVNFTTSLAGFRGASHRGGDLVRRAVLSERHGVRLLVVVVRAGVPRGPVSFRVEGSAFGGGKHALRINVTCGGDLEDSGGTGTPDQQWPPLAVPPAVPSPIEVLRPAGGGAGAPAPADAATPIPSVPEAEAEAAGRGGGRRLLRYQPAAQLARKLLSARREAALQEEQWQRAIGTEEQTSPTRRRLLDTYGDSLKFVNRLMDARFQKDTRRVPAHMPHLIDRQVVEEMQANWAAEFAATSRARFRGRRDMQFAFTHHYWLMHARNAKAAMLYFDDKLDLDHDGYLQAGELRRAAAVLWERRHTEAELRGILEAAGASAAEGDAVGAAPVQPAVEEVDGSWSLGARPAPPVDFPPLASSSRAAERRLLGERWDPDNEDGQDIGQGRRFGTGLDESEEWEDQWSWNTPAPPRLSCHNVTVWVDNGNGTDVPEIREVCEKNSEYDFWKTPVPGPGDPLGELGPPMHAGFVAAVVALADLARSGRKFDAVDDMPVRSWSRLLTARYFNGSHLAEILMRGDLDFRYKHRLAPDGDASGVGFLMAGDNATIVRRKLDRMAANRPKFVCINDNMNHSDAASAESVAAVQNFLQTLLPHPSSFEHPAGSGNGFLHTWSAPDSLRRQLGWSDPLSAGLDPVYASTFLREFEGRPLLASPAAVAGLAGIGLCIVAAAGWHLAYGRRFRRRRGGEALPC
eukprot:TRINITY_DN11719_c0_g1_i2.p1 TRINITY_DN11719_c0_g1~~TRINITY_DN11719_c0_g1_i2.p1  ORF type:complete len:1078 (+),score=220.64 TRINITY_DN11719_c0_g1_i2:102-3335(+)